MSDLTLTITLTDAGMAAVAAAHGQGIEAKITHVGVGDQGYVPSAAAVALHNELARVVLTAGGPIAPQQVLLQGTIPAGGQDFFIRELGYYLEDGTLLGVWSDPVTPLGWIGGATPWFFKLAFAWTSLPANAITVLIADDAGQAGMALDLSRLEGKVRHTVEVGGGQVWAGADNTQLTAAINSMINTAVAAVVNASPAALDTLKELALALGNDANFAASMTAALAAKAPLASPAFTGIPTAPTAALGTNTLQLANTAFVQAALAALSSLTNAADIPFWAGFTAGGAPKDLAVQRYGVYRCGRARKVGGQSSAILLAPTGAPVIYDHLVNGTSIWTVKPQYAAGSIVLTPGTINPAMQIIGANTTVEYWVTGVGSTIRGQGLSNTLICEYV